MEQPTKICCTCRESKSLDEFNRYATAKDGLQPRCRQCQREKRAEWYAANRESEIAKAREWNLANPERVNELASVRRARDPEKFRARVRETYERHGEKYQARAAARRAAAVDEFRERERLWRLSNKDSIAERKRRYRKTNPNVHAQERANAHRRRSGMKSGPTPALIQARIDYYAGRCWICGDEAVAIDHVKPLAKGGPHIAANLRPACTRCNSRKRDRWFGVGEIDRLVSIVSCQPIVTN